MYSTVTTHTPSMLLSCSAECAEVLAVVIDQIVVVVSLKGVVAHGYPRDADSVCSG